jgi:hypothetical protein
MHSAIGPPCHAQEKEKNPYDGGGAAGNQGPARRESRRHGPLVGRRSSGHNLKLRAGGLDYPRPGGEIGPQAPLIIHA